MTTAKATPKSKPKTKFELWPIENVTPYGMNVKKHDKSQVTKIAASITRFGFDQPIVVDKNGVIIKGHGRRLAAIELGLKQVPVVMVDHLTPEEVRASRLADNRVAQSDIDTDMLRDELAGLNTEDLEDIFDLKELEFSQADLGTMNTDVFATDMASVLDEQRKDLDARAEGAVSAETRVPLAKAFGFKDISAADRLAINRLMAKAEAQTGLIGEDALVAFANALE